MATFVHSLAMLDMCERFMATIRSWEAGSAQIVLGYTLHHFSGKNFSQTISLLRALAGEL